MKVKPTKVAYTAMTKAELIKKLEQEDNRYGVTRSDIIGMLKDAYNLGSREKDKWLEEQNRAEFVYDKFMWDAFNVHMKEPEYYNQEKELPF
jgi:hypothetical protein